MKPDPRLRACAGGAFWGTVYGILWAALVADDPFASLAVHFTALTIVLSLLWVIDGKLQRRSAERNRSWQSN